MPAHLATFNVADWEHLVGAEPANWGGRLMGIPWVQFKARRLFAQGRADWRRLGPMPSADAPGAEPLDDALAEQKQRSEAMIRSAIEAFRSTVRPS